jgi:hypothetical protein
VYLLLLLFILTANGVSPGGSYTTIQIQIAHITQNNTTIKQITVRKTAHTINTLHRMKIQESQLQLYEVVLIKISMKYEGFYVFVHSLQFLSVTER